MKYKIIFTCILFICKLIKCRNSKDSPEIKHLDSLKNVLFLANIKLAEIDSQKISKIFIDYQSNSGQIKLYFNDKKKMGYGNVSRSML